MKRLCLAVLALVAVGCEQHDALRGDESKPGSASPPTKARDARNPFTRLAPYGIGVGYDRWPHRRMASSCAT